MPHLPSARRYHRERIDRLVQIETDTISAFRQARRAYPADDRRQVELAIADRSCVQLDTAGASGLRRAASTNYSCEQLGAVLRYGRFRDQELQIRAMVSDCPG
jgi:hypothetical protein